MTTCPACAHGNPDEARFCNQCGVALAATAPAAAPLDYTPPHLVERVLKSAHAVAGERKQVTVLFADVKGSTRLAAQIGPEAWHGILDRLFTLLATAVHRFGGTVNQYTGDGVMALFGAPLAHEDHAVRACHAALAAGQAVRAFADELRLREGVNLSIRTGLNSGEVIVGRIGDDLRLDYTAQGLTVNLAARMEAIAEPGRICLTRHTADLVQGHFELRSLGDMAVAGADAPVAVHELLRAAPAADWQRLPTRRRGRFVGRDRELRQLTDALEALVADGRHGILAVTGEAGIGKSRLCHEFITRCRARGVKTLTTFALPYADAVPYFPVRQLLRTYFDIAEDDSPARIRRQVAGVLLLDDPGAGRQVDWISDFLGAGDSGDADDIDPARRMQGLHDLCARTLSEAEAPAVVLVEDAHWMDAGSETFFRHFVASLPGCPVLAVFNHRRERPLPWLSETADVQIDLAALTGTDLDAMLDDLLGRDPTLAPLRATLRERAGGNPFFIEEAVAALADAGDISGVPGNYQPARDTPRLVLPDSVQALLGARIDRLPQRDKQLLQAAAVVGKRFVLAWLAALDGLTKDARAAAVSALEAGGFIAPLNPAGTDYEFCHPLLQEVAHGMQLGHVRRSRHGQLAAHLAADCPEPRQAGERASLIAHHWELAEVPVEAARWQLGVAIWVAQRDVDAALQAFRKALTLVGEDPATPLAREVAVAASSGILRVASLLPVSADEAAQAYERGLRLGDGPARAELAISNASRLLVHGDARTALAAAREGVALAGGDAGLLGRFRIPVLMACFAAGELAEAESLLSDAGDTDWIDGPITLDNAASRALLAIQRAYRGQLDRAALDLEACGEVLEADGRRISWLVANQVEVAFLRGEAGDSREQAARAVAWAEESGSGTFREVAQRALAMAHMLAGDWQAAVRILDNGRALVAAGAPAHQFRSLHLSLLAQARYRAGEPQAGMDEARAALEVAERAGSAVWALRARLVVAELSLGVGDDALVPVLLDQVAAGIEQTDARLFAAELALLRGDCSARAGDGAAARQWWQTAAQRWQDSGAPVRAAAARRRTADDLLQEA